MTNSQVLQQAIERAIEGGWDVFGTENHQIDVFVATTATRDDEDNYYYDAPHNGLFLDVRRNGYWSVDEIVFDHDFARALFGELASYDDMIKLIKHPSLDPIKASTVEPWKYHLMALALSSDRISYLKDYMEKQS